MRHTHADGGAPGYFGIYPAFVTDLVDPDSQGRIQVRLPFLGDDGDREVRAWATLCTPYADKDSGLEFLPDKGSQVMVMFEAGNPRKPYIVGSVWNGKRHLPNTPDNTNNIRVLHSRAKSRLTFDDNKSAPKVRLNTRSKHEITIDEGGGGTITVKHNGGPTVKVTATSVEITGNLSVTVKAPQVQVTAPISTFSGIVQAQTVKANAFVISPAYTPGVGNIW
jgi:uncharacterized protein involved in type VI secretion and phage assembly